MAQSRRRVAGRMQTKSQPITGKRSDSIKAAWIGALAGSVVAAVLTGVITYRTATEQIKAEDQRATAEFLRQEQKAAYTEWLTAESTASKSEDDFQSRERWVNSGNGVPPGFFLPEFSEVHSNADEDNERLLNARSGLYLVGSQKAVELASHSIVLHRQRLEQITDESIDGPNGELSKKLSKSLADIEANRNDFIALARRELGSDPEGSQSP